MVEIIGDSSSLQRGFRESSRGAKTFERDLTHTTRGILAGSGALRSLGRSLAFASGGFIAFAGVSAILRESIAAASDAAVTQKQLGAQFKAAGQNLGDYQRQIDRTSQRLSVLSAFHAVDLTKSFTVAFRATRRVSDALKIEAVAAEAARGTGRDLAAVTLALSKAAAGSSGSLKRIGIVLPSTVKGMAAVAAVGQRFAGQLTAGVTAQDRLNNALFNSKEIIGKALLPTVVSLADHLAAYLTKLNETGRLQKDVNKVVKDAGAVVHGLETAIRPLVGAFRLLAKVSGGAENAVTGLSVAFVLLKARAGLAGLGLISRGVTGIGTSALTAEGRVAGLRASLLSLGSLGPTLALLFNSKDVGPSRADLGKLEGIGTVVAPAGPVGPVGTRGGGSPPRPPAAADPRRRPLSLQGRFNLLELALAKASLTASQRDDRAILVQQAAIKKQEAERSKVLKDRTARYQELAQIEGQIAQIDQTAAQKEKEARAKAAARAKKAREAAKKAAEKAAQAAATFTIPARLQLAEARAEAFAALHPTASGGPTALELNIARRIKTAALKALASGKKTIQGQIDAWNAITAANQTLSQAAKAATGTRFHKASASALISQYGLSGDAARALRASLAGIGPGGTVAGSGTGAFGYPTTHVNVELDGQKVARSVTVQQDRTRRRNPAQKRGPNAGR